MYAIDICHQNMRKQILNSSRRNIHIRITAFLDTGINILYKKSVKKTISKWALNFHVYWDTIKQFLCIIKQFLCTIKQFLCNIIKQFLYTIHQFLSIIKQFLCTIKQFLCIGLLIVFENDR